MSTLDFSTYSDADLREVADQIDRERFPANYQAARQELANRALTGRSVVGDDARRVPPIEVIWQWRRWISGLLIFSGLLGTSNLVFLPKTVLEAFNFLVLAALNTCLIWAGARAWHRLDKTVALLMFIAYLPQALFLRVGHYSLNFVGGFSLLFGLTFQTFVFRVNVVAVMMIVMAHFIDQGPAYPPMDIAAEAPDVAAD